MMKKMINKGFSLVELMVSVAIFGTVVVIYIGITKNFYQSNKGILETTVVNNYVNGIYNNIQSNIELYQVSYDSSKFRNMTSALSLQQNLPIAWDATKLEDVTSCPLCPGRMGYIIEPVIGYRGLYKLTIRVTHPKIIGFKDYVMLLVGK
jgi:prepilin-type N-terminal cleavage/methylation domain-containing protein